MEQIIAEKHYGDNYKQGLDNRIAWALQGSI